jgi:hypothetical protein
MQTHRGRADLLVLLERHGEARLDALALRLGYEPLPAMMNPEVPSTPSPTVASAPKPLTDRKSNGAEIIVAKGSPTLELKVQMESKARSEGSTQLSGRRADSHSSKLTPPGPEQSPYNNMDRYFRIVTSRRFSYESIIQPPDWYMKAQAFTLEDDRELTADPDGPVPSRTPLMPWTRLWPFLKMVLGIWQPSQSPDISRIVEILSREVWLRKLPRMQRRRWVGECQLIVDFAESLLPFWSDFGQLRRQLSAIRGRFGLAIYAFPDGDPSGRCQYWDGKCWQDMVYNFPSSSTPVLILSDLGCNDFSDRRRKPWQLFGKRLRLAKCQPTVLMPCPCRWWDDKLAKLFHLVCWDRKPHPPFHLIAPAQNASTGIRPEKDVGSETLLALLSPTMRVEPTLLRAARQLAGFDVGSEAAVWNHKAVSTNLLAFQYNPETLEEYRIKFPALCTIHPYLIELIDRHHGNISPAIYHEERLNLADLGILSDAEIEDSLHFMQRLIKTHQTVIGEIADDIATWVTCMTKRYTKEAWQRKERVALWL